MYIKLGNLEVFAEYPSITKGRRIVDYLMEENNYQFWIFNTYIQLSKELTGDDKQRTEVESTEINKRI